jgi:hypothetical protein
VLARDLKRPGVNLMMLWEEYRDAHPDGCGYSRFCDLFREFASPLGGRSSTDGHSGKLMMILELHRQGPKASPLPVNLASITNLRRYIAGGLEPDLVRDRTVMKA